MQGLPTQNPGAYPGAGKASLLRPNESMYLFQQQAIAAGTASIAAQIERIKSSYYPFGASMQIWFTDVNGVASDPGTFEVDFQTSDVDIDAAYYTIQMLKGASSILNASFQGGIQMPSFYAKFVRAKLVTLPNPVYSNILLTR